MSRLRTLVVCPGRGSYTADDLGTLGKWRETREFKTARHMIAAADGYRLAVGSASISELDGAERFSSALHLPGENAGPLIYTASMIDAACLPHGAFETVAIVGNSMGWYTALVVAGVLDFEDGLRVVDTMSKSGGKKPLGGQLVYPLVDDEWRPDEGRARAVASAIEAARGSGEVAVSIRLGGLAVLAGNDAGIAALKAALPQTKLSKRDYPFQLVGHSAYHTSIMTEHSRLGLERLADLAWRAPRTTLVDGVGRIWRPRTSEVSEIFRYTFVDQVLSTYDFTLSLRVALREFAPDVVLLLGPGDGLGGAIGQTLVAEGWNGIRSKADFASRQSGDEPILLSLGRRDVFDRFVRPHVEVG